MATHRYGWLQAATQHFAASRGGAWFFTRAAHHIDRTFLKLTGERWTLTSVLSGLPVVVLTTTGAKSGLPRTLPLLGIRDPDHPEMLAVVASNWGGARNPGWYYNLRANPRATGAVAGKARTYVAHEATGDEYERFWQRAVEIYLGFPRYRERAGDRHIPIMVLEPVEAPSKGERQRARR